MSAAVIWIIVALVVPLLAGAAPTAVRLVHRDQPGRERRP